jgi:CHAD domain-containing protein
MAYCLQSGERVPQGIKRIVSQEIAMAIGHLSGQGAADRDQAIHEARKNIKKIRGVLRLIQPELGDVYPQENALFRDIGRHLSEFRDGGAMLESFDALRKKYRGELAGVSLASIRRGLVARKKQTEKQAHVGEVLSTMVTALDGSAARVSAWPLAKDGFSAIVPGLEATFRRGQKAMARARKHQRPENFHDWRKRVKEHWYHVRLLEGLWNHAMEAYEKRLKELETCLGEDHNLVVLQDKVMAEPDFYGKAPETRLLASLIDKYTEELRGSALPLGARIYEEKPGRFKRRVHRLWKAWESRENQTHEPSPTV